MEETRVLATGRRKESVARVFLSPGEGKIKINGRPLEEYFTQDSYHLFIKGPLQATKTFNKFDVVVKVRGGGISGQAGAIRHGIARAVLKINEEFKIPLRKGGFLTRDPRTKERKKYGQKGARKRFQWTKR